MSRAQFPFFRSSSTLLICSVALSGCGLLSSPENKAVDEVSFEKLEVPPALGSEKWRRIAALDQGALYHINFDEPALPIVERLSPEDAFPPPKAQWSPSGDRLVWGTTTETSQELHLKADGDIETESFPLEDGVKAEAPSIAQAMDPAKLSLWEISRHGPD